MNPNTILEITLLVLIAGALALNYFSSKSPNPGIAYEHFRNNAFTPKHPQNNLTSKEMLIPYGTIMEIGYPSAIATLIAYINGEASLYLSNGNTVIGEVSRELLRESAIHFVQHSSKYVSMTHLVDTYPFPDMGQVRFYILTPGGIYSAEVPEKMLKANSSILSDLYRHGHYVIHQLGKQKKEREMFQ